MKKWKAIYSQNNGDSVKIIHSSTEQMQEIVNRYKTEILPTIDKSWTLFLDRDGVINVRLMNDYVKRITEFNFIPGALEAICSFSKYFGRIVVVTNQQGIGKGLMTEKQLAEIHAFMKSQVEEAGGKIDAIYHAPQLALKNSIMRKPNIGMALKAQVDFPEIQFDKSVMVGDTESDMQFAKSANMLPVFIDEYSDKDYPEFKLKSLAEFAEMLNEVIA